MALRDFTEFVAENEDLPVFNSGGVYIFGSITLGLKPNTVRQFVPKVVDTNHPLGVANILEEWVKRHPTESAEHLIDAMAKSKSDKTCVTEFKEFLQRKSFETGRQIVYTNRDCFRYSYMYTFCEKIA